MTLEEEMKVRSPVTTGFWLVCILSGSIVIAIVKDDDGDSLETSFRAALVKEGINLGGAKASRTHRSSMPKHTERKGHNQPPSNSVGHKDTSIRKSADHKRVPIPGVAIVYGNPWNFEQYFNQNSSAGLKYISFHHHRTGGQENHCVGFSPELCHKCCNNKS